MFTLHNCVGAQKRAHAAETDEINTIDKHQAICTLTKCPVLIDTSAGALTQIDLFMCAPVMLGKVDPGHAAPAKARPRFVALNKTCARPAPCFLQLTCPVHVHTLLCTVITAGDYSHKAAAVDAGRWIVSRLRDLQLCGLNEALLRMESGCNVTVLFHLEGIFVSCIHTVPELLKTFCLLQNNRPLYSISPSQHILSGNVFTVNAERDSPESQQTVYYVFEVNSVFLLFVYVFTSIKQQCE